ncbi:MAG: hypothetical protein R6U58_00740 [Bacteroidales bacterium]
MAGANSNKKYYANQENINKYTNTNQVNTYLDKSYEALQRMEIPAELKATQKFVPENGLPVASEIQPNPEIPTFIYNYYNLDPLWHNEEIGNRILLIEPDFFTKYPVSRKCINFMLALSKNIPNIQVYAGSFQSLINQYNLKNIYFQEHPFNMGYTGIREPRDWIAEDVTSYYPSFFSYWKKVDNHLSFKYNDYDH